MSGNELHGSDGIVIDAGATPPQWQPTPPSEAGWYWAIFEESVTGGHYREVVEMLSDGLVGRGGIAHGPHDVRLWHPIPLTPPPT